MNRDIIWNLFNKTGSVDFYLLYKNVESKEDMYNKEDDDLMEDNHKNLILR